MGPAPPQLSPYSRVYPVVPTNARVFYEKDIIIGDYHFPKNVRAMPWGPPCAQQGQAGGINTLSHPIDPLCPGSLCHVP